MATQIEYEVYSFHHHQELMRIAKANRALNRLRKSNPEKVPGTWHFVSRVKKIFKIKDKGYQILSTHKSGNEKNLISS